MATPFSPHGDRRACEDGRGAAARAFTLLELLAVVAVAGVLAALTFGAAHGARERSRRHTAIADLAVLAQALEGYRAEYGDYPATGAVANIALAPASAADGPGILFNALMGRRGPGVALVALAGRSFLTAGAPAMQEPAPQPEPPAQSPNAFLDPWGRRYLYWYRTGTAWAAHAPVLLSVGPDGAATLPADPAAWDGALPSDLVDADNLTSFPGSR